MNMAQLNRNVVEQGHLPAELVRNVRFDLPEKILQFGEGNFLRGFFDWMVHRLNGSGRFHGSIVAVQPTPHGKVVPKLNAQDGLYTLILRGLEEGKTVERREIVSSIRRGVNPYTDWQEVLKAAENPDIQIVVSNTTEAGLVYVSEEYVPDRAPVSFPGKLTACLYHRYEKFEGSPDAGWFIIPCELVDHNGTVLKNIVLQLCEDWKLPQGFREWVERHNHFCVTLVDRIVTGFPSDEKENLYEELGYEDMLLTVGEPYHLLVIDAPSGLKRILPLHEAGLNVRWEPVEVYRELKVRILNGSHALMCFPALLSGIRTVREAMGDPKMGRWVTRAVEEEILPTLQADEDTKGTFARSVLERFQNPYVKHQLADIALNSFSKFKARLLPTLKAYWHMKKALPSRIVFSLAALLVFYKADRREGDQFFRSLNGVEFQLRENGETLQRLFEVWSRQNPEEAVRSILRSEALWGEDLTRLEGLEEAVAGHVRGILEQGLRLAE